MNTRALVCIFISLSYCLCTAASPVKPEPRVQSFDWMPLNKWYEYHAEDVKEAIKGEAELVFLGDSITQGWDWELWQTHFTPLKALNFGIGGDKTQNILWRLQNGGVGSLKPKVTVLMAGVNNFGHDNASAESVVKGIEAIIKEIKQKFPSSRIVLLGILPYGESVETENRARVVETNKMLRKLGREQALVFRDYSELFLQKDGSIPRELMPDLLHPNKEGYALIAKKLGPLVRKEFAANKFKPTFENVLIEGRHHRISENLIQLGYPGVSFKLNYKGKKLTVIASSSNGKNLVDVYINNEFSQTLTIANQVTHYPLFESSTNKKVLVELVHRSETWHGALKLEGFNAGNGKILSAPKAAERKLIFIGDSITCGEALHRNSVCKKDFSWWDPQHSYGKLLGKKLKAQSHLVCHGGRGILRSWNGRRDEQQAPGYFHAAIPWGDGSPTWDHSLYQPDLIFIALGTNDFNLGLKDFPDEKEYVETYSRFIEDITKAHPDAKIVLTDGPMVNNEADPSRPQKQVLQSYLKQIQNLYKEKVHFLESNVYAGDSCDAHPTAAQHKKLAEDFYPQLKSLMNW